MKPLPHETPEALAILRRYFAYYPESGAVACIADRVHYRAGDLVNPRVVAKDGRVAYRILHVDEKQYQLHRVAWALHHGEWPKGRLDHENHQAWDNRLSNLRPATPSQNNANRITVNKLGARGVTRQRGRYLASCRIGGGGRKQHVGSFGTLEEAAHAYNKAANAAHGEFAILNPVGIDPRAA